MLSYRPEEGLFSLDRDNSGQGPGGERRVRVGLTDGLLKLRIFVDKSSVEVFIGDGEHVVTARIYPGPQSLGIQAFAKGTAKLVSLYKWDIV
ncbi:Sucrose-6-phosphate hydrolase [compost metagenome]